MHESGQRGYAASACDGVILQRLGAVVEGLTKVTEVFLGICIFNVPNKSRWGGGPCLSR